MLNCYIFLPEAVVVSVTSVSWDERGPQIFRLSVITNAPLPLSSLSD